MIQQQLKADTRACHEELEGLMYTKEIMEGNLSLIQYGQLIVTNYRVTAGYEQAIVNVLDPLISSRIDLARRRKVDALLVDLLEAAIDVRTLTVPTEVPVEWNDRFILGCLYVLEGATLGGSFIYKKLKNNPELAMLPLNFNYYQVYRQSLIPNWNQFVLVLNEQPQSGYQEILDGAKFMFRQFKLVHGQEI
jgi:heme oxygenase